MYVCMLCALSTAYSSSTSPSMYTYLYINYSRYHYRQICCKFLTSPPPPNYKYTYVHFQSGLKIVLCHFLGKSFWFHFASLLFYIARSLMSVCWVSVSMTERCTFSREDSAVPMTHSACLGFLKKSPKPKLLCVNNPLGAQRSCLYSVQSVGSLYVLNFDMNIVPVLLSDCLVCDLFLSLLIVCNNFLKLFLQPI